MNFRPQKVEPGSASVWFKDALALSVRKPIFFISATLVFTSICYLPKELGAAAFIALPLLLGLGCVVAECADNGRNPFTILMGKPSHVWGSLLVVGLVPWLALTFIALLAALLVPPGEPLTMNQSATQAIFRGGSTLLALAFLWFLVVGYWLWFVIPLIAVAEISLPIAIDQADEALTLNRFIKLIALAVAFSCLVGFFNSIVVFPWVAIVSCMMYVSYRHIWLDRAANLPVLQAAHSSKSAAHTAA